MAKTKFLADTAREKNLDFIALLEKHGRKTLVNQCLAFVVGETFFGTGLYHMGGQVVFC